MPSTRTAITTLATALLIAGCGAGKALSGLADDAVRSGDDLLRSGDELADGSLYLRPLDEAIPPAQAAELADDLEPSISARLQRHLDGLSEEQAVQVTGYSCAAKDWLEVGMADSVPEAVQKAMVNEGGNSTLRQRVEGLTEDLEDAGNSGEIALQVAAFAVCEAVDAG
ncbi:hypothetical protein [Blastococcus litoris]|uniref:hypothetical protein n=1 Tax=Blastococcus litoris TaxID=2171622 RepID=UPI000E30B00B|nr:hypothetical protein [Blastococcus litoris]